MDTWMKREGYHFSKKGGERAQLPIGWGKKQALTTGQFPYHSARANAGETAKRPRGTRREDMIVWRKREEKKGGDVHVRLTIPNGEQKGLPSIC